MNEGADDNPMKVAIVGMTGSGKTVLITTLSVKMAQMSLPDIFMAPYGQNRRKTLEYTQRNWQKLNSGQWPASTPAGELVELQWELNTKSQQAMVRFLDCAGQDIRSLFNTENFNPDSLSEDLRKVYDAVNVANVLIFLVNMKDLLASSDNVSELLDLDQMIYVLKSRNDIPRKMAVVFSQYDKYKSEVEQKFDGDFLKYIQHYLPYLFGQYVREGSFVMIPVAAVNDTQSVIENGEVKQYPAPGFSSFNLDKLIYWIANSVEDLVQEIAAAEKQKKDEALKLKTQEDELKIRMVEEKWKVWKEEKEKASKKNLGQMNKTVWSAGIAVFVVLSILGIILLVTELLLW